MKWFGSRVVLLVAVTVVGAGLVAHASPVAGSNPLASVHAADDDDDGSQRKSKGAALVSYLVKWDNGVIVARDPATGQDACSGQDFTTVVNCAFDLLTPARTTPEVVAVDGSFDLASAISIPSYTTLDLRLASVFRVNDADTIMFQNADGSAGNTQIKILGGTIDGNAANQHVKPTYPGPADDSQYTVYFDHVTESQIQDTKFSNANDATIHMDYSSYVDIDHITVDDSKWETVWIYDGGHNSVTNSTWHNTASAVATAHAPDVTVSGNTVIDTDCACSALTINGRRNIVTNNRITNASRNGIALGHPTHPTLGTFDTSGSIISGNIINGAGLYAIHMVNGAVNKNVRINGNIISDTNDGISIGPALASEGGVQNIVVDNNIITGSQHTCVRVQGSSPASTPGLLTAHNVSITNNMCVDNGQGTDTDSRYPAGLFNSAIAVYSTFEDTLFDVWVVGNRVYDTQETPTQEYGVYLLNTNNTTVLRNDLRGSVAPLNINGSNPGSEIQDE